MWATRDAGETKNRKRKGRGSCRCAHLVGDKKGGDGFWRRAAVNGRQPAARVRARVTLRRTSVQRFTTGTSRTRVARPLLAQGGVGFTEGAPSRRIKRRTLAAALGSRSSVVLLVVAAQNRARREQATVRGARALPLYRPRTSGAATMPCCTGRCGLWPRWASAGPVAGPERVEVWVTPSGLDR
jgi:hypothetical protein